MLIPEDIPMSWYEDEKGNQVVLGGGCIAPERFKYLVSRSAMILRETTFVHVLQKDVDSCTHTNVQVTDNQGTNWMGRRCLDCGGEQTKKKYFHEPHWWPEGLYWPNIPKPWPKRWRAHGMIQMMSSETTISSDLFLALCASFEPEKAMLIAGIACERCSNVLRYNHINFDSGYPELSDSWHEARTSCPFCEHMIDKSEEVVPND